MSRLADYLEERRALLQGAGLALLYPAIVALVALAVVAGLLAYVVPQVAQVFQQSRQELPLLTRAMLWISGILQSYLLLIGIAGLAAAFAARAAYAREALREKWQRLLLRMPVVGPLVRGNDTARLASTLAILVGSGVPLLQALVAGTRVLKCIPLRRAVEEAVERVREGSSLHRALGSRRVFPPLFIHLVSTGEQSGRLARMLARAAKQQQTENEARVRLLAGILEPAVIVAMGGVVLLVVLAILLPIIELNQLVRP